MAKYEAVAYVGDPWDYGYKKVVEVSHWKDARRLEKMGKNIYLNGERVFFVNHDAVKEAFNDLKFDQIVGLDIVCDSADIIRKNASDIISQNEIKIPVNYKDKIDKRYQYSLQRDPLEETFVERKHCIFYKGKWISGKIETEELPF